MLGILVKNTWCPTALAVFEHHDPVLELLLQKIRLCCYLLFGSDIRGIELNLSAGHRHLFKFSGKPPEVLICTN